MANIVIKLKILRWGEYPDYLGVPQNAVAKCMRQREIFVHRREGSGPQGQ